MLGPLKKVYAALLKEKVRRADRMASYNWQLQARESQKIPEGDWRIWLILAGRGFGKTRTGAETIRQWVNQKKARRICLLGDTFEDVRQVMVEGVSGLLSVSPPGKCPTFEASKGVLTWPCGAVAQIFTARAYEKLRGPQFDAAWVDELAKFPNGQSVWDQLMLGLRLGENPRAIVTTTPLPTPLISSLVMRKEVYVTRGSTFENAENLAPSYLKALEERYAHTRLGEQEIEGKILEDNADALWTYQTLEKARLKSAEVPSAYTRIVVAVDPAVTSGERSDETGIIVAARDAEGCAYILNDYSGKFSTVAWAERVVKAYHTYAADRIIAEVNNGGDLVEKMIRSIDTSVPYKAVRASRGKVLRAEPVAALYQQGKIRHVGVFKALEAQMRAFQPAGFAGEKSPDRVDALVWALTELLLEQAPRQKTKCLPRAWRG